MWSEFSRVGDPNSFPGRVLSYPRQKGVRVYDRFGNGNVKGTHTIHFSSSFYIMNQKPMIHIELISLYNHMGCTLFWVKFGNNT